MTRAAHLTPKASKLYKVVKDLRRCARKLEYSKATKKSILQSAAEQNCILLRKNINVTTANFFNSQMKMQQKKKKGRRFTVDDKIFALSILKQSPKCYKLLQRTFALPSRKTLLTLLNKVPFNCGINQQIFKSLEKDVKKMEPIDRVCCLMFDEMSLQPSITYDVRQDEIVGFVKCGNHYKTNALADHAMVFMVRGLHRKWKQPVAYYFTQHGMKVPDIVRNIKQIITALQKIGLNVVATISDQHPSNSKAISNLKEETNAMHLRKGIENRLMGFYVNQQEVVHLYDPPHLLKCVRNNLLMHNCKFTWKRKEQAASWNDIETLYDLDVGDSDTKMLNKLTDAHVRKNKIKKMKVKIAAQVFSHRVSSTMRGLLKHGKLPNIN